MGGADGEPPGGADEVAFGKLERGGASGGVRGMLGMPGIAIGIGGGAGGTDGARGNPSIVLCGCTACCAAELESAGSGSVGAPVEASPAEDAAAFEVAAAASISAVVNAVVGVGIDANGRGAEPLPEAGGD